MRHLNNDPLGPLEWYARLQKKQNTPVEGRDTFLTAAAAADASVHEKCVITLPN